MEFYGPWKVWTVSARLAEAWGCDAQNKDKSLAWSTRAALMPLSSALSSLALLALGQFLEHAKFLLPQGLCTGHSLYLESPCSHWPA